MVLQAAFFVPWSTAATNDGWNLSAKFCSPACHRSRFRSRCLLFVYPSSSEGSSASGLFHCDDINDNKRVHTSFIFAVKFGRGQAK